MGSPGRSGAGLGSTAGRAGVFRQSLVSSRARRVRAVTSLRHPARPSSLQRFVESFREVDRGREEEGWPLGWSEEDRRRRRWQGEGAVRSEAPAGGGAEAEEGRWQRGETVGSG